GVRPGLLLDETLCQLEVSFRGGLVNLDRERVVDHRFRIFALGELLVALQNEFLSFGNRVSGAARETQHKKNEGYGAEESVEVESLASLSFSHLSLIILTRIWEHTQSPQ